jgi:hypothetical protein
LSLHSDTHSLANVRISGQTVRSRLREFGIQARCPVVGPILKQHHRTARLAWAHHAVVGGFTPGNTSLFVILVQKSLDKHEPCDILHCHVERRDQSFAVAEKAEYRLCILRHSMFLEQF